MTVAIAVMLLFLLISSLLLVYVCVTSFNASTPNEGAHLYIHCRFVCIRGDDADMMELEAPNISTKNGYGNENKSNRLH